jgi:hypothetical protein
MIDEKSNECKRTYEKVIDPLASVESADGCHSIQIEDLVNQVGKE